MALILVLLFVVLLTAIVIEYGYENRVEATFVESAVADFEAEVAAKSAVAAGLSLLSADLNLDVNTYVEGTQVDSFQDAWAMGIAYRPINKAVLQCLIDDEYGKINLSALLPNGGMIGQNGDTEGTGQDTDQNTSNTDKPREKQLDTATRDQPSTNGSDVMETEEPNPYIEEALRALFAMRGAEEDPVDAILDWIDTDDEARPEGAESDYYGALDIAYACKNGPLSSVEELLLIRGITPEIFFGDPEKGEVPLTEILTVHGSRRGDININTAERETLESIGEAFGMSNFAETVMDERESSPFTSPEDLESRGITLPEDNESPTPPKKPSDRNNDEQARVDPTDSMRPAFICSSQVFRIRGTGTSGDAAVQIEAYVTRNGSSYDSTNGVEGDDEAGNQREQLQRVLDAQNNQSDGEKTFALLDWRVLR